MQFGARNCYPVDRNPLLYPFWVIMFSLGSSFVGVCPSRLARGSCCSALWLEGLEQAARLCLHPPWRSGPRMFTGKGDCASASLSELYRLMLTLAVTVVQLLAYVVGKRHAKPLGSLVSRKGET